MWGIIGFSCQAVIISLDKLESQFILEPDIPVRCNRHWRSLVLLQALLKHGLLPSILTTVLTIMATPADDDDLPEDNAAQSQSPISLAAQVLFYRDDFVC